MTVNELSPEQIGAIAAGAVAILGTVLAAARKSAKGDPGAEPIGGRSNPYLLVDAVKLQNLVDQIGLSISAIVRHRETLEGYGRVLEEHRRVIEKNTAAAEDVIQGADRLTDEVRELRVQIAINNRGQRDR